MQRQKRSKRSREKKAVRIKVRMEKTGDVKNPCKSRTIQIMTKTIVSSIRTQAILKANHFSQKHFTLTEHKINLIKVKNDTS